MKKCQFCAEEIQDEAIKCKHCGEFIEKRTSDKWYSKISVLVIAFLCVGPFALPLVWVNPRFSKKIKFLITIIIVTVSCYLGLILFNSVKAINNYYKQLFQY